MMGQETQSHMMMPAQPAPDLVVVQAQAPFTLLECRFDRPAHTSHPDQRGDRYVTWRITEIDLELRSLPPTPSQHNPHVGARHARAYRHAAVETELRHQRPFAPFFYQERLPCVRWHSRCELINALWRLCSGHQASLPGLAPAPRPGRHCSRWPAQPDLRVVGHFGKVPAPQRRHLIQEGP